MTTSPHLAETAVVDVNRADFVIFRSVGGETAPETCRYLRGGMAVTIVLLGTAVFIAALCALGAMLIVYKSGNDTEDVLLNLAGILAFVVAVVPTLAAAVAPH